MSRAYLSKMPIDYEDFRTKSWPDRLELFNAAPATDKAELVRTHIGRWLDAHRAELTEAQIAYLEECRDNVHADLYRREKSNAMVMRMKELESRGSELLTRDQMREALTLHW
jgi:hypothetical protein